MRSLLSGLGPDDVRLDPFPHLVVPNALDEETHRRLNETFPPFSIIGWAGKATPRSNSRFQLSAWQIMEMTSLPDLWKTFVGQHSAPAFFAEVVALFRDHWPTALKEALGGDLLNHPMGLMMREGYNEARILQDARIEINTPVTTVPSTSRGPHLDMPNRLFTCLYYLRHPDDDAVGGDLELFRWKNGPIADTETYALPDDAVEVAAVVPYQANQMVIFPQGIDAIHGVSVRHPTPHTRRYVFISAEIEQNWLVSPAAAPLPVEG